MAYSTNISHLLEKMFYDRVSTENISSCSGIEKSLLPHSITEKNIHIPSPATQRAFSLTNIAASLPLHPEDLISMESAKGTILPAFAQAASGHEADALSLLFSFTLSRVDRITALAINQLADFLLKALLGAHTERFSHEELRDYLHLCRRLPIILVGVGIPTFTLPALFFRARKLSQDIGDTTFTAIFELLIGSLNACNVPSHGNRRFHEIMRKGYDHLLFLDDPDILIHVSPYIGIFHFFEGNYRLAATQFEIAYNFYCKPEHKFLQLFCLRHWSSCLFNMGDFSLATSFTHSELRKLSPRSDGQLTRTLRGQIGIFYLRSGQMDKALDQIDIAQNGISPHHDIVGWLTCTRFLASYHLSNGHIHIAYKLFSAALLEAKSQHYLRPTYLNGMTLELLYQFHAHGLPPVACYSLKKELERCLNGPVLLLRGVAARLKGNLLRDEGNTSEAEHFYELSLSTLREASLSLETSKTCLEYASLLIPHGRKREAQEYLLHAWPMHIQMRKQWTPEQYALIPPALREEEDRLVSTEELLAGYRNISVVGRDAAPEILARAILEEACRLLSAEGGHLFYAMHPTSHIHKLAELGHSEDKEQTSNHFLDLMRMVMEGSPMILDKVYFTQSGRNEAGMMTALPIDCRPNGIFVLCMHDLRSPEIRTKISEALLSDIGRILTWELSRIALAINREKDQTSRSSEIIYSSAVMGRTLELVDKAAASQAAILISGETGVGKEMVARRIHKMSSRSGKLICVNASSFSAELFENEFFGHEKGAFTGAIHQKRGLLDEANNGTLFLDEITEMPLAFQAKLLRALQEKRFYRVGGLTPIHSDFRLISATNRDIEAEVRKGNLRSDLFYRISVIQLYIPPLRERRDDILAIASHYLSYFSRLYDIDGISSFSSADVDAMQLYDWPGNIRELRNVIEQSVVLYGGRHIELSRLNSKKAEPARPAPFTPALLTENSQTEASPYNLLPPINDSTSWPTAEELEKRYIAQVMERTGGRVDGSDGAAAILGIKRSTLYNKLKRYGIR